MHNQLLGFERFDDSRFVGVDITKPVRKIGDRFRVVFYQRSGSQLTELGRAQIVQQSHRVYIHYSLTSSSTSSVLA